MVLSSGCINSGTTASNAVLAKMQAMAKSLNASLVGEEGENLTAVEIPGSEITLKSGAGCLLAVLVLLAAVVWWFFFR